MRLSTQSIGPPIVESNTMRRTLFAVLCFISTAASADSALQGAWEIASTTYDDEVINLREPRQIKIFTAERVIYTYYYEVSE